MLSGILLGLSPLAILAVAIVLIRRGRAQLGMTVLLAGMGVFALVIIGLEVARVLSGRG